MGAVEQVAVDRRGAGQVVLAVDALHLQVVLRAVGQRQRERRAEREVVRLGLARADEDAVRGEVLDVALLEPEVEHGTGRRRVDHGDGLALAVDRGVVDADARGRADLGHLVEVVGQLRAQAAEAEVVHADHEVAVELLAEDLAHRLLDRRRQHRHAGDQRDTDQQGGRGARGPLGVAGRVLARHRPGHALGRGDRAPEELGHRSGDQRSEDEQGDEQQRDAEGQREGRPREQPDHDQRHAHGDEDGADDQPALPDAGRFERGVTHRGDRGHAARSAGPGAARTPPSPRAPR